MTLPDFARTKSGFAVSAVASLAAPTILPPPRYHSVSQILQVSWRSVRWKQVSEMSPQELDYRWTLTSFNTGFLLMVLAVSCWRALSRRLM